MKKNKLNSFWCNFIFIITLVKQSSPKYLLAKIINIISQVISNFVYILFPKFIIDSIINKSDYHYTLKIILLMSTILLVIFVIRTYR